MRLAVIADVHADIHALRDALAQAERLGCTAIVCSDGSEVPVPVVKTGIHDLRR